MPHVIPKAGKQRKIVVVGAGPGGLEAARVSAERGHRVVLFEKEPRTGGQVAIAAKATWREALSGIPRWLTAEVKRLSVDLRLGTEATPEAVRAEDPDVLIIATGGRPNLDGFTGSEHAVSSWAVLTNEVELSGSVLLYDVTGQHQGASTAEVLATRGCLVEIATEDRMVGEEIGPTNQPVHLRELYKLGVVMSPNLELIEIYPERNKLVAALRNTMTDAEEERLVDHIVIENGTKPVDGLYRDLKAGSVNKGEVDLAALVAGRPQPWPEGQGYALYRLGDAVAGRNIHAAIYDALRLCKDL